MNDNILEHTSISLLEQLRGVRAGVPWVLVDPTFCPLGREETVDRWIALAQDRVQPAIPGYEMHSGNCPLWLACDLEASDGRALIAETLEYALAEMRPEALALGRGRRVCGLIVARDGAAIAQNTARLLVQRRPDGSSALVRLYDPAVLWGLWSSLRPAQRRAWTRSCEAWWLLRPDGQLMAIHACMTAPSRALDDVRDQDALASPRWASLLLTPHQWEEIDAVTPFNLALREWQAGLRGKPPGSMRTDTFPPLETLRDKALDALRHARRNAELDIDRQIAIALSQFPQEKWAAEQMEKK